jgi:putative ABC transport system permease protein
VRRRDRRHVPRVGGVRKGDGAYFPVFNVEAETIVLDIVFSLVVGVLAAVIPVYRTLKMKIADGLRMIE